MALYNYMTPEVFNQQQFNPNMPRKSSAQQKQNFLTKASPYIDVVQPFLNLAFPGYGQAINLGIDAIQMGGQIHQNKLDQQYQDSLQMETSKYLQEQNNPYSMNYNDQPSYGNGGGMVRKTPQQRMVDDQAFNNSNNYGAPSSEGYKSGGLYRLASGGGLSRKEDYGSKNKPYPSVKGSDFASGDRSYPIPTRADAVDALRLAGLHGRSDVRSKVYSRYPDLRPNHAGGGKQYWIATTGPQMEQGGNYGMIPGNGHSKSDDKGVNLKDGSYVIPNDTNSKDDPKIQIAKSLLAFLGHDSDKKFNMNQGGSDNANISSKEMVLNPAQSDQFDQMMGGEFNKEAFFTPNSQYNQAYPGMHQMPDGSIMPDEMMNKGGKKGLMGLCYQGGGPFEQEREVYAQRMKQEQDAMTKEEMDKIAFGPSDEYSTERSQQLFGFPREGEFYKNEPITHPVDTTHPDYFNPQTGMTNKEKQIKDAEDLLGTVPSDTRLPSYYGLTPEQQDQYNKAMGEDGIIDMTPQTTPPTTQSNAPGTQNTPDDAFAEAQRLNKLVHGLEAGATVGMGLYNLLTKYKSGPKPLEYTPEIYERDFMGLQSELDKQTQLAGATARYNARNVNQTPMTNSAIHANELQQLNKNAAMIHDMQQQDQLRINQQKNQATLYNLANINRYNEMEAERLNQFRIQKGQVLSDNISTLSEIGKDYMNNKVLIDTASKGTKLDSTFKDYMNFKNYERLKDPNNPIVRRDADGNVVYRKDASGKATTEPEYLSFEEYLAKKGL